MPPLEHQAAADAGGGSDHGCCTLAHRVRKLLGDGICWRELTAEKTRWIPRFQSALLTAVALPELDQAAASPRMVFTAAAAAFFLDLTDLAALPDTAATVLAQNTNTVLQQRLSLVECSNLVALLVPRRYSALPNAPAPTSSARRTPRAALPPRCSPRLCNKVASSNVCGTLFLAQPEHGAGRAPSSLYHQFERAVQAARRVIPVRVPPNPPHYARYVSSHPRWPHAPMYFLGRPPPPSRHDPP